MCQDNWRAISRVKLERVPLQLKSGPNQPLRARPIVRVRLDDTKIQSSLTLLSPSFQIDFISLLNDEDSKSAGPTVSALPLDPLPSNSNQAPSNIPRGTCPHEMDL
jgi:hypothetical protein